MSIHIKPLQAFFIGGQEELRPAFSPLSRFIPTTYTVAGSVFSRMVDAGLTPKDIEESVSNGFIKVHGVYLQINEVKYVRAPMTIVEDEDSGRIEVAKVVEDVWGKSLTDKCGLCAPLSEFKVSANAFMPLSDLKEGRVTPENIVKLYPKYRNKLGIALERDKKTVKKEYLYLRSDIEAYEVKTPSATQGSLTLMPSFCIDITFTEKCVNYINHLHDACKITKLGGEEGLSKMSISQEAPLADLVPDSLEDDETYMAISHVHVKRSGSKLLITFQGEEYELKWCIGVIESLGGWLLKNAHRGLGNKPKDLIAALSPGSVFKVEKKLQDEAKKDTPWYYNLLNTIVKIKVETA